MAANRGTRLGDLALRSMSDYARQVRASRFAELREAGAVMLLVEETRGELGMEPRQGGRRGHAGELSSSSASKKMPTEEGEPSGVSAKTCFTSDARSSLLPPDREYPEGGSTGPGRGAIVEVSRGGPSIGGA